MNSYPQLKSYNYWRSAMTIPAPGHIDPVVRNLSIMPTDRISTMGSCFAQHLATNIVKSGYNHFITEEASSDISSQAATHRNYGIFSARYGNVYTVKQALQLFERAFGEGDTDQHIWQQKSAYIDALRPRVEPNGFATSDHLVEDRLKHYASVRRIFMESDYLIFTLGLTEAWRSKKDKAIYPIAPFFCGVDYDESDFEFVNFCIDEVTQDLRDFVGKIRAVNPHIHIILTVSPVPLVFTYEDRHVWVSTTISKSILRVASDIIEKEHGYVTYFPAYEIITSPANEGRYYADNLRQVTDTGVNHVMRIFSKHFLSDQNKDDKVTTESITQNTGTGEIENIVCDEDEIENAIRASGLDPSA